MYFTENYWKSMTNRRKWFDAVAKTLEFDPLLPENWYNVTMDKIESLKVN